MFAIDYLVTRSDSLVKVDVFGSIAIFCILPEWIVCTGPPGAALHSQEDLRSSAHIVGHRYYDRNL